VLRFGIACRESELPRAADPEQARLGIARWREALAEPHHSGDRAAAEAITADAGGRRLLEAVFGNSPYLAQSAAIDPAFLGTLLAEGPDRAVAGILDGLRGLGGPAVGRERLAASLRVTKRRLALAVAVADISSAWPLSRVTGALTEFAERALAAAVRHALMEGARTGAFKLARADDPERDSGLIVLGMGKFGARELNYSSDIDILVLYDSERLRADDPHALQNHVVRLVRGVKRLMDERTPDGYVFRTDLRLRPDPGATPLAISTEAAEVYYESQGQNWERAAMIKARPVAGDLEAGRAFLDRLRPYVWRKNLDFAAIQDIHSIKRQIAAHRGGGDIAVEGHNIKLGRGGIREIEFFVQTQQLIWGGREPRLRVLGTVEGLRALADLGKIGAGAAAELIRAYEFLRRLEHRLQMRNDEQVHALPRDAEGVRELAVFLGYAGRDAFAADLLGHLSRVEAHYARLFEDAPRLSLSGEVSGDLVFTGVDADPETLGTLRRLGFADAEKVHARVRAWHHGRYRAMRSARARELLTELMPRLLKAFADTPDPDAAFVKFDEFLSRLPAGVQLFSMFHANPHLLDLIAEIAGAAPRLADHLALQPSVLDAVLVDDFFEPPPPLAALAAALGRLLDDARSLEEVLDASRRWANDRKFQAGVHVLRGRLDAGQAGFAYSNVAEAALAVVLPRVSADFARQHGVVAGAEMAVVALGKLGGREMTPASDLDLVFLHTAGDDAPPSDGAKPLPPIQYYARLSQRLINAVTAPTREGRLYEVDMRLRPTGRSGPIANSLDGFLRYHREAAWTWERMALTRARAVAGPDALKKRVNGAIRGLLSAPVDPERLLLDVAEMRERVAAEHPADSVWEVKHARGGLVDIEFIAQYLELEHARAHPHVLSPNTWKALRNLADAGLLGAADAERLTDALTLWQSLQTLLHLAIEGGLTRAREREVPKALQARLAAAAGAPDFAAAEERMRGMAAAVREIHGRLIGEPARALAAKRGAAAPASP
jgi:glutamate-ammonia-ligase adenylyltransferase